MAIAIERYIYLSLAKTNNHRVWKKLMPLLQKGDYLQVAMVTEKSRSAISHIFNYGLNRARSSRRRDDVEIAMEEGLMETVPNLEKRTQYLSSRQVEWVQPERPLFAGFFQRGKEFLGPSKGSRVVEDRAMHVCEEELASRGCSSAPSQRCVDGGFGQIVGHSLPQDERARLFGVTCRSHHTVEVGGLEVGSHDTHPGRQLDRFALKDGLLLGDRVGMVDLKNSHLGQAVEPIGPRVESGTENHDLIDAPTKRSANRVVDESRARNCG